MIDEKDRRIIASLQGDFPLVSRPYAALAENLGISEDELIARLACYRERGQLRRLGAVLRHREVGYRANALCACRVGADRMDAVGAAIAARPEVTHCYARETRDGWPYDFYMMLHARTREEACEVAAEITRSVGIDEYRTLFSVREWKKTSMRYFSEEVSR